MDTQNIVPVMEHDVTGNGGAPLVLVPGGLTGWISWTAHAQALAASRKVIRLQLLSVALGLNGTPLPPDYSVNYEVDALHNTLDELGVSQADFAAWSYGAAITLSFAIHHPDRVHSLTLIEPPAIWVLRSRGPLSPELLEEQKFQKSLATDDVTEEQLVWFCHFAGFVPRNVDPRTLPQWPAWYKHRQSLRNGDGVFLHEDNIDLVRKFDKPVLLVKGEGSSSFLHNIIDILAEEFPNVRVVTFPGGHAPHLASMQPFLDRFSRFLNDGT